jgi:predicted lipid-binding transport protein (Tim44 family)
MSDFELLFFAGIACFFVYKLWSVLGRTNGDEKSRAAEIATIIEQQKELKAGKAASQSKKPALKLVEAMPETIPEEFATQIAQIKKIDPAFSLTSFMQGANGAFEAVLEAYSNAKLNRLKFLLNDEIFKNFEAEIAAYKENALKAHASLVSIDAAELVDVELEGKIAQITVQFDSEQINFVTNEDGEVVEGSKTYIERVTDVWVFERNLTSAKPQWLIVGTHGE